MDTIAVIGATGAQGGAVVAALQERSRFRVRALTRNPDRSPDLGDEVAAVDLTKPETIPGALNGAYGVFANTNSFGGPDTDEIAQGQAVVEAAKSVGVRHFVWSTLPDVDTISNGRFDVPHFTNKARVDPIVSAAGFEYTTFTEPPFYYQNLISPMYAPVPGPDGTPTWSQPMAADLGVIHMGDIDEYGNLVAGAFERPDLCGDGQHLSFAGDLLSWDDIVGTLREQANDIAFRRADAAEWDGTFPGAREIRQMFEYMEAHTYFGPDTATKTALADAVTTKPFTSFSNWAKTHMAPDRA